MRRPDVWAAIAYGFAALMLFVAFILMLIGAPAGAFQP